VLKAGKKLKRHKFMISKQRSIDLMLAVVTLAAVLYTYIDGWLSLYQL
jgi:hypothetical protein